MPKIQSDNISELIKALVKVQSIIEHAPKDSTNPFFKSKYSSLTSVWDTCREPLTKNGLAVIQTSISSGGGNIIIVTTLSHTSGQWIRGWLDVKPEKDTPQGRGSAITYARRYALAAIVGIAPEDDDAEGAMERDKKKKEEVADFEKKLTPMMNVTQKKNLKELIGKEGYPLTPETMPNVALKIFQWYFGRKINSSEEVTEEEATEMLGEFKITTMLHDFVIRLKKEHPAVHPVTHKPLPWSNKPVNLEPVPAQEQEEQAPSNELDLDKQ